MAGILDFITGQNPNQGAINANTNAANQATGAENQLIQQALLPAYNQLLQNYQQNYSPLQGALGKEVGGVIGSNQTSQLGGLSGLLAQNPALLQKLTGVNALGVGQNAVNYFSNPGATLSGLGGVGGTVLGGELGPTALGAITPQALQMFTQEAQNGLSPQTIGSALNTQEAATQSQINSLRNAVGAGTPNIGGLTSDLNLQGLQGLIGTESQLAGMNQTFQNQGMQNALGAASGLDQQQLQRLLSAESTAGTIDQNTANMLSQAYQIASGINQGAFGNVGQGLNLQQGLLGDVMNYTGQGLNSLLGGTSGISNIANLYGNAASGAAGNAMSLANAGNQATGNIFSGLAGLAGSLAGAGIFG